LWWGKADRRSVIVHSLIVARPPPWRQSILASARAYSRQLFGGVGTAGKRPQYRVDPTGEWRLVDTPVVYTDPMKPDAD
jgi:hypothetical protein